MLWVLIKSVCFPTDMKSTRLSAVYFTARSALILTSLQHVQPYVPQDWCPELYGMNGKYDTTLNIMSCVRRKPVIRFSDQVLHKLGCAITEDG